MAPKTARRPLLCLLLLAAVFGLLGRTFLLPKAGPEANPEGRQQPGCSHRGGRRALLLGIPAVLTVPEQAEAAGFFGIGGTTKYGDTKSAVTIQVPQNDKTGIRAYAFEKPAGFKKVVNPGDPSGYVFRSVNDTYNSFATRAELRENASTDFKPEDFINDYRSKFVNATGSAFDLIKGGGPPNRVDEKLGVKYYKVEYVVRTQLGFSFDSLKTLHFITLFAVNKDSINVMNVQALDDKWAEDGPTLRKVVDSFAVTL
eukprot:TRINITY_DN60756_c0_g1_i1.p1 TRINITY_DN60756_c0_g1~~TRINITY_DN60756_c0_g1_i1.p1  ORF type:complete len:257 (-),score=50.25 TRINITY_DN60756_c0_g1_i1:181-951(-)